MGQYDNNILERMEIDFITKKFAAHIFDNAIIWKNRVYLYSDLISGIIRAKKFIELKAILPGEVIALNGDFTPNTIALLLALIENSNIIVPFTVPSGESEIVKFSIAGVEKSIVVNIQTDDYDLIKCDKPSATNEYYVQLRKRQVPGLVLFTSGTSGEPKAAVHDFQKLLLKFKTPRKSLRTVNFLLFDHWGGLNTLFHTLSNAGVVLSLHSRKPDSVCDYIEKYKIELLPVSPSFLNILLFSGVYRNYDCSSLKLITYGTEPMPESTLKRAKEIFSHVKFQQTYGLIELGVLRSKSKSDDSLWVKLGGEGYELRVIDNMLQIKADSAMLGYINAPSPFTADGYFMTGDLVEEDGDFYKILGRKSELINVGGEKVYPQEVENVILEYPNVADVTVYGEKNAITGNIVCANINLESDVLDKKIFIKEIKGYLKKSLKSYKVPVKINILEKPLHSNRFKKQRSINNGI